ncbi:MAG TPA: VWA domain-containing protein [Pyrinomonadaceae bacterium]|nr:VWA domain-containing protein [Pyrinomonadaceae bacterium]
MRFFQQSRNALALAATLLLIASFAFNFGTQAQTPAAPSPSPQQQQPTPAPTPTPHAETDVQDDAVERVETNLVNVFFNAADKKRRFVTTLRQEDVQIYENNELQTITLFQRETDLPLSLAILIDVSGSQERTLPDEKEAAHTFIDSVIRPDKDKAAIISFTGDATVEQDMTGDRASLNSAIDRVEIAEPATRSEIFIYEREEKISAQTGADNAGLRGSTAIWDAIWATATDLLSQTPELTRRAIILLSDGADSTSRLKKEQAIEAVIAANAVVYSIGIGDADFDESALKKVSERTGGHAFFPEDEAELNAAFAQIQQELRTQYLIAYSPTNKARDNTFRQLRIDLVNPQLRKEKLKLTYRNGYFARPPAAAPVKRERPPKERLARPRRPPKKR